MTTESFVAQPRISPWVWLCFLLLAGCLFVFGILTPPMADDYYFGSASLQPFADIMAGASVEPLEPAHFSDIFRRAAQMYTTWDGRFLAYIVIGSALWFPQTIVALVVALVCCLTVFLTLLHVLGSDWRSLLRWWHVPLAASLLLWGMPTSGSVYFWHTGLAYAMDLCGALLFLLPFRFLLERPDLSRFRPGVLLSAAYAALGFCQGLLQYNTPIICLIAGAAATCRLWFLNGSLSQGERLRRLLPLLLGLLSLAVALTLLFSSPGNIERLRISEGGFIGLSLLDKIALFLGQQPRAQRFFWLPWLLTFWGVYVLARRHGRAFWRHIPLAGAAFLLLGQMGQGAFLFSPAPAPRAYTSAVVFMLLGACILARAALPYAGVRAVSLLRVCGILFCLLFWGLLPYEISHMMQGRAELAERALVLAEAKGKDVSVPPMKTRGRPFFPLGSFVQDIAYDQNFWINRIVAAHWGASSVVLQMPPERYFLYEEKGMRVLLRLRGEMLSVVEWPKDVSTNIYVYYLAKSSFLAHFPAPLADSLTGWIAEGKAGDARLMALPLLLSITHLPPDSRQQRLWGIFNGERLPLWLVQPGDGPASFDILPLRELDAAEVSQRFPSVSLHSDQTGNHGMTP